MISKRIAASVVAASMAVAGQAGPARADDALAGAIVGAIIGGAIVNEAHKNKQRKTKTRSSSSGQTSAQREANREVQVALNHFGFNVGTPDGAIGPRSRGAISEYQAMLGYPATGQLTEYERTLLVGSYHRAVAGGALTMQQAAQNPMGMRGLLLSWRDESLGVAPPVATAAIPQVVVPQVLPQVVTPVITPTPDAGSTANPFAPPAPAGDAGAVMAAVGPESEAEAAPDEMASAAPALPSFLGAAGSAQSLGSHCNKVSLVTSTNGGYTTVATMSDPMQALGEQFCLARGYAIALGEDLASQVQGFTPDQIAAQCDGFGPAMASQIASLSLKPREDVVREVEAFALSTGMAPQQLSGTAKICLSAGYKADKMDVAVASALILASLGEGAYGELLGHHLSQGFGATQRPDLALAWYEQGLDAAGTGTMAVFAPGQPERLDLIRKAALIVGGKPEQAALPEAVPAALPSFEVPAAPAAAPEAAPEQAAEVAPDAFVAAPEVAVAAAAAPAGEMTADKVDALPFVAQLPFLLFRN